MRVIPVTYVNATSRKSNHGRWLRCLIGALILTALGACATDRQAPRPTSTMLLVSLEDGSIIRQEIVANADVCLKSINDPATMCFLQGAPILNGNQVIGYEMNRSEIQLLPK